jgi:phosphoribosylformylglycinamidine synthase
VADALQGLGFDEVQNARIGKVIELELSEVRPGRVEEMAKKLLANSVIENFRIEEAE